MRIARVAAWTKPDIAALRLTVIAQPLVIGPLAPAFAKYTQGVFGVILLACVALLAVALSLACTLRLLNGSQEKWCAFAPEALQLLAACLGLCAVLLASVPSASDFVVFAFLVDCLALYWVAARLAYDRAGKKIECF